MPGPLVEARDRIAGGEVAGPRLLVAGNIGGWGGPCSFTWSGVKPQGLSLFQEQMNDAITRGSGEELLELEPDPLADIRNIRKLSLVMKDGRIIDHGALPERPVFRGREKTKRN